LALCVEFKGGRQICVCVELAVDVGERGGDGSSGVSTTWVKVKDRNL
jgi:hypothetical protein